MAIVQNLAKLDGHELITERADIPIESETLDVKMSDTQDRSSGGLVASTRLDADETVLDDVDTANTVLAGELIESEEDLDWVGVLLLLVRYGHFDGETSLELDGDAFGGGRGVFGSGGEFPHVGGRGGVGVLENTGFVGDVEEVLVG